MKTRTITAFVLLTLILLGTSIAKAQPVVVAEYETAYGDYGKYRGRAHNIRLASSILSGTVLMPGQTLSFNEAVGRRTIRRGFREAPVIKSGRMTKGVGGGICQVASTLHAAALYSGLTIVEHHHHSRISSYIDPGLDATVDWGTKDFVIRNDFNHPITIAIDIFPGTQRAQEKIRVRLLAQQRVARVEVTINSNRTRGFRTIRQVSSNLAPGEREVLEGGTPGMYVTITRFISSIQSPESVSSERIEAMYEPSNRIILVGEER